MKPVQPDDPTEPQPFWRLWQQKAKTAPMPLLAARELLHTRWFWAAVTGCAAAAFGLLAAAVIIGPVTSLYLEPGPTSQQKMLLHTAPKAPADSPSWTQPVWMPASGPASGFLLAGTSPVMHQSESPESVPASSPLAAAPGSPVATPAATQSQSSAPTAGPSRAPGPTYAPPWKPSPSAHTTRPTHPATQPPTYGPPPSWSPSTPAASTPPASTPAENVPSSSAARTTSPSDQRRAPVCLLWVAGLCVRLN
jgi:hypothetical protein